MKSVTKTFLMLCIALSVFMCNSTSAFAAVCEKSEDGVHHFDKHRYILGSGYNRDGGNHMYLYGYDHNDRPIYKNDCKLKLIYNNCNYICSDCHIIREGMLHSHQINTIHSINHN